MGFGLRSGRGRTKPPHAERGGGDLDRASPGLVAAMARVSGLRGLRVLDLGTAIGANLELYRDFADAVTFADLARACGLGGDRGVVDPERPARVVAEVVAADSRPLDLVLAWDLFDYLSETAVEHLVRVTAERSLRGATLLAFVTDTGGIPSEPGRWVIRAPDRVVREATPETSLRPGPGWPPARVAKLLPGFEVERTFVLGCGAREYVAVRC